MLPCWVIQEEPVVERPRLTNSPGSPTLLTNLHALRGKNVGVLSLPSRHPQKIWLSCYFFIQGLQANDFFGHSSWFLFLLWFFRDVHCLNPKRWRDEIQRRYFGSHLPWWSTPRPNVAFCFPLKFGSMIFAWEVFMERATFATTHENMEFGESYKTKMMF